MTINSQSLEDTQVGYISQKYTLDNYTLAQKSLVMVATSLVMVVTFLMMVSTSLLTVATSLVMVATSLVMVVTSLVMVATSLVMMSTSLLMVGTPEALLGASSKKTVAQKCSVAMLIRKYHLRTYGRTNGRTDMGRCVSKKNNNCNNDTTGR